jgi:hypothetical protein
MMMSRSIDLKKFIDPLASTNPRVLLPHYLPLNGRCVRVGIVNGSSIINEFTVRLGSNDEKH